MGFIKKTGALLAGLSFLYVFFVGILYVKQDSILYHPTRRGTELTELAQNLPEMKEVSYFLPSGEKLYAWYRPAKKGKKTVVYFHGNTLNVEQHCKREPIIAFYKKGYGLLLPEYRGYGDLKGKTSQLTMEEDAKTAIKYLNGLDIQNKNIFLYGHSIGTYTALYAAAQWGKEKPFAGVILEAPFYSAESVGYGYFKHLVPVRLLLKNKYPSNEFIGNIHTRLFIGHGKKDKTIPINQGWQLYDLAQEPKTFFISDNSGHNDLPNNGLIDAIFNWIEKK